MNSLQKLGLVEMHMIIASMLKPTSNKSDIFLVLYVNDMLLASKRYDNLVHVKGCLKTES